MSSALLDYLGSSTIASSDADGSLVTSAERWAPTVSLAIVTPPDLTGNCVLQISTDVGVTWVTVQVNGADVALAAGKCVIINSVPSFSLRVHSDSAEVGDRVFQFWCILQS